MKTGAGVAAGGTAVGGIAVGCTAVGVSVVGVSAGGASTVAEAMIVGVAVGSFSVPRIFGLTTTMVTIMQRSTAAAIHAHKAHRGSLRFWGGCDAGGGGTAGG